MSDNLTLKIVWVNTVLTLQVTSTDTIKQIKMQLEVAWGFEPKRQMLYISSQRKVLQDDKTLADYDIVTNATIDFMVICDVPESSQ